LIRKVNRKTKAFVTAAAKLADERHCSDIVALDMRKVSQVTDYFLILTGTSDRQMRSVADVVVHIFNAQSRKYYDLEMLWGDAKKLKV